MPLEWAVRRSTAKWVLPVLVGPRTALTGWEEEEVIFLEAKLAWARAARNSRSSNGRDFGSVHRPFPSVIPAFAGMTRWLAKYPGPATPRRNAPAQIGH
ncbi:hypothetical protein [uncultured Sphingopyxis sp.]|uniref:hypothetical protein n=1 Tax=uncultured Sphingopyxis sp. TaxID=310581 RepID=UPI0025E7A88A|nr:hypothetical protein [uncultured Sphingopyxis sp.]